MTLHVLPLSDGRGLACGSMELIIDGHRVITLEALMDKTLAPNYPPSPFDYDEVTAWNLPLCLHPIRQAHLTIMKSRHGTCRYASHGGLWKRGRGGEDNTDREKGGVDGDTKTNGGHGGGLLCWS
jgi:hypothetical protein